jgi:hypothetical protein
MLRSTFLAQGSMGRFLYGSQSPVQDKDLYRYGTKDGSTITESVKMRMAKSTLLQSPVFSLLPNSCIIIPCMPMAWSRNYSIQHPSAKNLLFSPFLRVTVI